MAQTAKPYERPLPPRKGMAAEFYKYCKQHELRFQRCTECNAWRHIPRVMCPECGSFSYEWAKSSGRGRLYSWITVVQPMMPSFAAAAPYSVALVEMEEGVKFVGMIEGAPPEELKLGLPMEVIFDEVTPEVTLPKFRRVRGL